MLVVESVAEGLHVDFRRDAHVADVRRARDMVHVLSHLVTQAVIHACGGQECYGVKGALERRDNSAGALLCCCRGQRKMLLEYGDDGAGGTLTVLHNCTEAQVCLIESQPFFI